MYEILTGLGLALPAGLNAYIPLLIVGLTARFSDLITLNAPYDFLASDLGLAIVAVLLLIEIVADKVPLIDHVNDLVQTVIRPAAGGVLMLASTGVVDSINPALALVLGIFVAGSVHAVKATTRPALTAATGGIGNPIASVAEDTLAVSASLAAILFPLLVVGILLLFLIGAVLIVRRTRRFRARARLAKPTKQT